MSSHDRQMLWVVACYWLVLSGAAFIALEAWIGDVGPIVYTAASALAGAVALAILIAFAWILHLLLDRLPEAIRRALRTPLEKYTDLVNSGTERGIEERAKLMARLEFVIESERMREKIFRDTETGQRWIEAYVELSWSSRYDMIPIDAGRAALLIANYRQEA